MSSHYLRTKSTKPIDIGSFPVKICPPSAPLLREAKRREKIAIEATRILLLEASDRAGGKSKEIARRKARKNKQAMRDFFL